MNRYYHELADLVFGHYKINPYIKIAYDEYYLTIQDYLVAVSHQDPVKNIYSLLHSFSPAEAMDYLAGTIAIIIQETLRGNEMYKDYYLSRLKAL